jgi:hypothetical protein
MRVWFTRPLTPLVAMLACAVGLASVIGLPAFPASRMASVASAQAQAPGPSNVAPTTPTAKPTATASPAKLKPTLAPRRPHADPISQAKAVLVAPATFRPGGHTTLDATGSVGDRLEWKITGNRFLMIGDGRRQAITLDEPDAPNAADPFAVTLLVYTQAKDGVITSIDSTVVIVKPAGVAPAPPGPAPPVVVDPSVPPVVDPATKPTAAYYVFEKDDGAVPPAVQTGLDRLLREKKIDARPIEQDVTDGTDRTPEAFKAPIAAAKQAGLPAFVVMAGSEILSVTKNPTTEEAILAEVSR